MRVTCAAGEVAAVCSRRRAAAATPPMLFATSALSKSEHVSDGGGDAGGGAASKDGGAGSEDGGETATGCSRAYHGPKAQGRRLAHIQPPPDVAAHVFCHGSQRQLRQEAPTVASMQLSETWTWLLQPAAAIVAALSPTELARIVLIHICTNGQGVVRE